MKIAILGSMQFSQQMQDVGKRLADLGHTPIYSTYLATMLGKTAEEQEELKIQQKNSDDAMRKDIANFKEADAVLVLNLEKHGVQNYIGGNTFLEMGIAHYQGKKIFLWNPIPENPIYESEIRAMSPLVTNGNLENLPNYPHNDVLPLSIVDIKEGHQACIQNAKRLLRCAKIVKDDHEGDSGVAYAIWTLSVEEYGKALELKMIFEENKDNAFKKIQKDPTTLPVCSVPNWIYRDHKKKFKKGTSSLQKYAPHQYIQVDITVYVSSNTLKAPISIDLGENQSFFIGPGMTGWFEDITNPGIKKHITVDFRFDSLYVNYTNGSWLQPGIIPKRYIEGLSYELQESINRSDLGSLMNSLDNALAAEPRLFISKSAYF